MTTVVARNLSVRYGDGPRIVEALRDFNLTVQSGEFVVLVGPSGCGKSTFLRTLAGFVQPTSGSVQVDGGSAQLGFLTQDYGLFPWMTVRQNLEFPSAMRARPAEKRAPRVEQLLASVDVPGWAGAYPHELSGGMRQRVALARVFASEPRALLLDEPFGALDGPLRRKMRALVEAYHATHGTSILFTTHDVEEALLLADRVIVMTSRPGTVKAVHHVPFSRPRAAGVIYQQEFQAMRRRIDEHLES